MGRSERANFKLICISAVPDCLWLAVGSYLVLSFSAYVAEKAAVQVLIVDRLLSTLSRRCEPLGISFIAGKVGRQMLLGRITQHVYEQNWTAIFIDFVIVVVGVFIGIQVANWNDALSDKQREKRLLGELSSEIRSNSDRTRLIGEGLLIGADAARRVLSIVKSQSSCGADCWPVVVDLMHASQWQRPNTRSTTYEELRRAGLPSDRRIIESVERHQAINDRASVALERPPAYRSLVRQLLPIELQDQYWQLCYVEEDGGERYRYPCPKSVDAEPINETVIEKILNDAQIVMSLREWTSFARLTGHTLVVDQSAAAQAAIDAIRLSLRDME